MIADPQDVRCAGRLGTGSQHMDRALDRHRAFVVQ